MGYAALHGWTRQQRGIRNADGLGTYLALCVGFRFLRVLTT